MIIRIVRMTFDPLKSAAFLKMFEATKEKIGGFEGCSHLELLQDIENPNIFFTYSYWESPEALEKYRHSELFKRVWKETKTYFSDKAVAYSVKRFG